MLFDKAPKAHCLITTARGEGSAVRGAGERPDRARMLFHDGNARVVLRVPQSDA